LAKRRFGCTRYQVRETAFVFEEKRGLKHQWENKKTPVKTGSLLS
jgi:hypothetical protein